LLCLLGAPSLAHPGDHAFVRIQVRGSEVQAELDLPAQVLATLDRNGDFLLDAREMAGQERFLASSIQLASQGLAVTPHLELLPTPAWQEVPESLIERGNSFVLLKLTYRWPYEVRQLSVRFDLFAVAAEPDCSVRLDGLGPRQRLKLKPDSPTAEFGTPSGWMLVPAGGSDLSALACLAGLAAAQQGRLAFLVAYLVVLAGFLSRPSSPFPATTATCILVLALLTARVGLSRPRLPLWLLSLACGAALAAHRAAGWQIVTAPAACWFAGGTLVSLLLAGLLGRLAGRRQPVLAGGFLLLALLALLSS
jgi:hypothetical protein